MQITEEIDFLLALTVIFRMTMLLFPKSMDACIFEVGINSFGKQHIVWSAKFLYKIELLDAFSSSSKWAGEKES